MLLPFTKAAAGRTPVRVCLQQSAPVASGQAPAGDASAITENPSIIQTLAGRMAESVEKSKPKKVLVFDFVGPDTDSKRSMSEGTGKNGPKPERSQVVTMLGRSLANEFGTALGQAVPKIEVRRWDQFSQMLTPDNFMPALVEDPTTAWWVANGTRFDLFVWGDFERAPDNKLSLRVLCYRVRDGSSINGLEAPVLLSPGAKELADAPAVEPLDANYPAPGKNGITYPACLSCPQAQFPLAAVHHMAQGRVELEAIITEDGRAKGIKVLRGLPYGFTENAIEAVRGWRFAPALGPDGKPTAVHQIIIVTFRVEGIANQRTRHSDD